MPDENDGSDVSGCPDNAVAARDLYAAKRDIHIINNYIHGLSSSRNLGIAGEAPAPTNPNRGRQSLRLRSDSYPHRLGTAIRSARVGRWPVIVVVAAALVVATMTVTGIYVLSPPGSPARPIGTMHPGGTPSRAQAQGGSGSPSPGSDGSTAGRLSAADRKFVSDMRGTFTFRNGVQDSVIALSGERVCSAREADASVASETSAVQHYWTDISPGGAIQIIVLAEKDICPAEHTAQVVTYVVTGSYARVTYGPTGSEDQGTVPMSVTQSLGSPRYYVISAQLQGSGSVSCQIKVAGVTISSASASGGYNIADCGINHDATGSWINANNAG